MFIKIALFNVTKGKWQHKKKHMDSLGKQISISNFASKWLIF
jgi:hypothetical protein